MWRDRRARHHAELRLAEGKLLRWGERATKAVCALQSRDLEILVALARYRFLTTGQIAELWWEGRGCGPCAGG